MVYEQPDSLKPVVDKLKARTAHAQNVKNTHTHNAVLSDMRSSSTLVRAADPQQAQHRGDRGRARDAVSGRVREVRESAATKLPLAT